MPRKKSNKRRRSRSRSLFGFGNDGPLTIMPFGPPGPWIEPGPQAPSSSAAPVTSAFGFSSENVSDGGGGELYVNPSGYNSLWYGAPSNIPPSWNFNLRQGGNIFPMGMDQPKFSNVMNNSYFRNY